MVGVQRVILLQLSREGSGWGGRSHHRHRHHPPANPPTNDSTNPSPTASAEIATITINPADVAMAAVLM